MNGASRKSDFVTVLGWTSAIMGAYGLALALAIAVPHVVLTFLGSGRQTGVAVRGSTGAREWCSAPRHSYNFV